MFGSSHVHGPTHVLTDKRDTLSGSEDIRRENRFHRNHDANQKKI